MALEIVYVDSNEELDGLVADSALTIEGLSEEAIPEFLDYIKERTKLKKERAYVVKGKKMNEYCGCRGSRKYKDDLTIVSVKLSDMENWQPFVTARFEFGGRWFDDIVDNNRQRG